MVRSRRAAMAMGMAAALALAACGSSDGSDGAASTTTAKATTSTTAPTTTTVEAETSTTEAAPSTTAADGTTTSTTESSEGRDTETSELDTLSDGDHIGHIAGVENATVEGQAVQVILFDEVEVLTGQAAIDAATEDGVAMEAGYYVRDADSDLVSIAVAPDAQVTTLDGGSPVQVPSSVSDLANAGEDALHAINTSTVRGVTLVNGIKGYYLA